MIMTVVDMFMKETVLVPCMQNITSEGTARLFFNHVVPWKGLFRKVVSDRGPQFASNFMRDTYKLLGIKRNLSTAFHPQTDGQTERMNQEVEKYLRIFINERQTDWADWLPMAQFALNNRVNRATGYSLFYLNHGRHPNDGFRPQRVNAKCESAEEFVQGIAKVHEEAKAALRLAQERMKADYDKHTRPSHEYNVGDKAWVKGEHITTDRPSKKLDWKWYGPFKILQKYNASSYLLELLTHWKTKLNPSFNERNMKPFIEPEAQIQKDRHPRPPPAIAKTDEWEVEEILNCRNTGSRSRPSWQYLILWKGHPRSERSWEPLRNVMNAQEAIQTFHDTHPDTPNPQSPIVTRGLMFDLDEFPPTFFDVNACPAYIEEIATEPIDKTLPTETELAIKAMRARPPKTTQRADLETRVVALTLQRLRAPTGFL